MLPSTQAQNWLRLYSPALTEDLFHLVTIEGNESFSQPLEYQLTAVSAHLFSPESLVQYLGKRLSLQIASPIPHFIHNLRILVAEYTHSQHQRHYYRFQVAHALALLASQTVCRRFENQTTVQILNSLLEQQGIQADFEQISVAQRRVHPLIVQYHESHLAFIHRLLREAGWGYYYSHAPEDKIFICSYFQQSPHFLTFAQLPEFDTLKHCFQPLRFQSHNSETRLFPGQPFTLSGHLDKNCNRVWSPTHARQTWRDNTHLPEEAPLQTFRQTLTGLASTTLPPPQRIRRVQDNHHYARIDSLTPEGKARFAWSWEKTGGKSAAPLVQLSVSSQFFPRFGDCVSIKGLEADFTRPVILSAAHLPTRPSHFSFPEEQNLTGLVSQHADHLQKLSLADESQVHFSSRNLEHHASQQTQIKNHLWQENSQKTEFHLGEKAILTQHESGFLFRVQQSSLEITPTQIQVMSQPVKVQPSAAAETQGDPAEEEKPVPKLQEEEFKLLLATVYGEALQSYQGPEPVVPEVEDIKRLNPHWRSNKILRKKINQLEIKAWKKNNHYEAFKNSSSIAWQAVTSVIMNRVNYYPYAHGGYPQSVTEVIQHTGFDAYTHQNEDFLKAKHFMDDNPGWVLGPRKYKSEHNGKVKGSEPPSLEDLRKAIVFIYLREKPCNTEAIAYFSPRSQRFLHQKHPKQYHEDDVQKTKDWTTHGKPKEYEEDEINQKLSKEDDFKFFKYTDAFKQHLNKQDKTQRKKHHEKN